MIDKETQSLWSQLLGRAMEGKLKGKKLKSLPSSLTSWKKWKQGHPDTTVIALTRTSRMFRNDYYRKPEKFVVGLADLQEARAWPFDSLTKQPLVNDHFGDTAIVIHFDRETAAAHIFRAEIEKRPLTFKHKAGEIVDSETGSTWDMMTGKATKGPLFRKQLSPLPAIPSYRNSWEKFYPDSEYWSLSDD